MDKTVEINDPALDEGLDKLLNERFAGRVVRKDLTKLIKEGANVPVYVLEYLLGMYCASDDEETIRAGLVTVKSVLTENYVRPDEAEKVKSKIRERGSFKVIDKVTVKLNENRDAYEALLSNLGIKNAEVPDSYVRQFEKLLVGGIWCIVTLNYRFEENQKGSPFVMSDLKPIQMPNMDMAELFEARKGFTEDAMDRRAAALDRHGADLLQGAGEVAHAGAHDSRWWRTTTTCASWGRAARAKSHIYKEISPNSILVSGGQTTVANLCSTT
jgi:ATP-dependent Lon protease